MGDPITIGSIVVIVVAIVVLLIILVVGAPTSIEISEERQNDIADAIEKDAGAGADANATQPPPSVPKDDSDIPVDPPVTPSIRAGQSDYDKADDESSAVPQTSSDVQPIAKTAAVEFPQSITATPISDQSPIAASPITPSQIIETPVIAPPSQAIATPVIAPAPTIAAPPSQTISAATVDAAPIIAPAPPQAISAPVIAPAPPQSISAPTVDAARAAAVSANVVPKTFLEIFPNGTIITLKASDSRYLSVNSGSLISQWRPLAIISNSIFLPRAREWRVVALGSNKIALQSRATNQYLAICADCVNATQKYMGLVNSGNTALADAQWTPVVLTETGKIALKSSRGTYLTVCPGCAPSALLGLAAPVSVHATAYNNNTSQWTAARV